MKTANIATGLIDKVVDFQELVKKLLHVVLFAVLHWPDETATQPMPSESDQSEQLSHLVQLAVDLILPCVVWQPDLLLKEVHDFQALETLLVRGLLHTPNEPTRKAIERAFRLICTNKHDQEDLQLSSLSTSLLLLLLKNMPRASDIDARLMQRCEEYFGLIAILIKTCAT